MQKKEYIYGVKRDCLVCGKTFQPRDKSSKSKYCSYSCNNKSRTINKPRKCVVCSEIIANPHHKNTKTCGRKCGTTYRLGRRKMDPMVIVRKRLAVFCCSVIARSLRGKTDTTKRMLGYSAEQLRSHLESQFTKEMTWQNYGKKTGQWSIDHKRPISKFPISATIEEINALQNLQPLWHSENCRKRNRWEGL